MSPSPPHECSFHLFYDTFLPFQHATALCRSCFSSYLPLSCRTVCLTEAGPGFFHFLECSHICFFPPYCLITPNLHFTSPHNLHLFYQSSLLLPLLPSIDFSLFSFHRIYHPISPDTIVALVCNTHGQSCLVDCGRQADVCEEGVCALEVLPVPLRCEREPSRLRLLGLR